MDVIEQLEQLGAEVAEIQTRLEPFLVGQRDTIELMIIALLAAEHCYFEAPPGSAKALTTRHLATAIGLTFGWVHCHAEMAPTDLFEVAGADDGPPVRPMTANCIYVDDLPRLAPQMHALIQQAMQEGCVKVAGQLHSLALPHLVTATAYRTDELAPHPYEPRDDRFMLKLSVRYPEYTDEYGVADVCSGPPNAPITPVWNAARILEARQLVRQTELPPTVVHYALRLVRATRVHEGETPDFVYEWVLFGAGPRAAHFLTLGARIRAAITGRPTATAEDIRAVAYAVLRHRIQTNENARSNGITVDRVIERLLDEIPARAAADEVAP